MAAAVAVVCALGLAALVEAPAAKAATGAVLPGFNDSTFGPNDDASTDVSLGFPIKFFGQQYTSASLNNNGNLTFGESLGTYTPYPLSNQGPAMIAAFFADVDTRVGNTVTYGNGTVDGHQAFGVDWPAVGCYNENDSVRNTFQLILVNRSDLGAGDFDIEFNYDSIQWDSGQASGGDAQCLNGTAARAGYASGAGATGTYYELPGSGSDDAFLDSNSATGLIHHDYGSTQPGRYIYQIRNGLPGLTSGAPVNATGIGSGDLTSHDPTCSTAHPVNCASGDFWHSTTDLSLPERGNALDVTRTYNSLRASDDGAFGHGWSWSLGDKLTANSDGSVTVTAGDGSQLTAEPDGTGTYTVPTWANSSLQKNADGSWRLVLHQRKVETFDSAGQLTAVTDLNGNSTTLSYDHGSLSRITDPAGRTVGVTADSNGRITRLTDPLGRSIAYGYNSAGDLTSVTDRLGRTTSYSYDAGHQLVTMTDPASGKLANVYDGSGRVVQQTDPLGRTTKFSYSGDNYSALGGVTTETDPNGNVTTQQYLNGELTTLTHASGTSDAAITRYTYDPVSLGITSLTDPRGNVTTSTYDAAGNLLTTTDPLGRTTRYSYDALGDLLSKVTPAGHTTTYRYDAKGNVTAATDADGHTTTYAYGDTRHPGDLTSVTDPDGRVTAYSYDGDGDLVSATTTPRAGLASTVRYAYDRDGELTCKVAANLTAHGALCTSARRWGTTTIRYDRDGEVLASTDPDGNTTRYAYDNDGNQVAVTDAAGHTTRTSFDADGEVIKVARADGSALTYTYDGDGNQLTQTDADGHTTRFSYDALDRQTASTDPLNRTTRFGYDADGNRTTITNPAGQTTTETYDQANQLTGVTYSDGTTPNATFGYDADGDRVSMKDGTGTSSYTYDPADRLTAETNGAGATVHYGYDGAGHVTQIGYPNGQDVSNRYDGSGNLVGVTDWLGKTFSFQYDRDGNVTAQADPNAVTAAYQYNGDDQVLAISDTSRYGVLARFSYGRDRLNQVTSSSVASVPGDAGSERYTYDALNQVASDSGGRYGYDSAGDLNHLPGGGTQTFDAAGELTSSTQPADSPGTGQSNSGAARTVSYGYDSSGNRTSTGVAGQSSTNLSFNQANELTSFGTSATYAYDGDGLRSAAIVRGTKTAFTWDEAGSLPLMLAAGDDYYVYGPNGLPLEKIADHRPTYLLHDQQGSTRLLTDEHGRVTGTYTYSTYGQTVRHTGPDSSALQFDGQYTDAESGFQYLQARYYDPRTGVFLSSDPLAQITQSPYAFAYNSPVNLSDPDGRCGIICTAAAGAVGGAIVGGVISATTYLVTAPNYSLRGFAAATAGGIVGGAITGGCDGATFLAADEVCGAVGGGLGEATTEFINGQGYDPYTIAEATVTGGAFGAVHVDIAGEGDHYGFTDRAINEGINSTPIGVSGEIASYFLAPGEVC